MNLMFADMVDVCVLVYLDDILIFSRNREEHRRHVHMVFQRLADSGFHVKRNKCTLFTPSVEFLGHVVSQDGVSVCPTKVGAVRDWPRPETVRDV